MGALADRISRASALKGARPSLVPAKALPEVDILSGPHRATRFSPHWHEQWGLAAIEAGACHFTCAGTRCLACPGDLVLLPALAVHTAGVDPAGLHMTMAYLPTPLVAELLSLPPEVAPAIDRYVLRAPVLARRLSAAAASGDVAKLRTAARAALRRFHDACGSRVAGIARPEDRDARVAVLCAALRAPGRPDLAGLAARMGLSRGHFQRLFRRTVGLTPAEYARLARLAEAKGRLAAGDPPADVAANTGFADQAHLTRWMRAVYGVTPSRFVPTRRPGRR